MHIYIEEGPHVPVLKPAVTDGAQVGLRGGQFVMTRTTNSDIEKMKNYES